MERVQLMAATAAAPTTTGAAVTVSDANYVMIFNGAAAGTNPVVTLVTAASGTVLGTVSVGGGERIIIKKDPSEVLYAANAAVLLTKVNPNVT